MNAAERIRMFKWMYFPLSAASGFITWSNDPNHTPLAYYILVPWAVGLLFYFSIRAILVIHGRVRRRLRRPRQPQQQEDISSPPHFLPSAKD